MGKENHSGCNIEKVDGSPLPNVDEFVPRLLETL